MRTDEAFYNISMYLYNKNVLEYAQIARNETESKIPYIEGCSNKFCRIEQTLMKFNRNLTEADELTQY